MMPYYNSHRMKFLKVNEIELSIKSNVSKCKSKKRASSVPDEQINKINEVRKVNVKINLVWDLNLEFNLVREVIYKYVYKDPGQRHTMTVNEASLFASSIVTPKAAHRLSSEELNKIRLQQSEFISLQKFKERNEKSVYLNFDLRQIKNALFFQCHVH